jgi:hypothetical protein
LNASLPIVQRTCLTCGGIWWQPAASAEAYDIAGTTYFCPNGHGQYSTVGLERKVQAQESTIQALRAEIIDLRVEIADLKGQILDERRRSELSEARAETAIAKRPPLEHIVALDRHGHFCCPRCAHTTATWQRLAMHLTSKHADTSLAARYAGPTALRLVAVDSRQASLLPGAVMEPAADGGGGD